jgi:hypothetical protein
MNKFTNPEKGFDPRQPLLDCSFKVINSQFRGRIDPRQPLLECSFKVINSQFRGRIDPSILCETEPLFE